MTAQEQPITVPRFTAMKAAGRKITMVTAYDYAMASLVDSTGVEGILVGDSLSMVVQGHPNTLPVTLGQMIYHAEMVGRAVRHALVVADMPFLTYQVGVRKAIANAGQILKRTRCQAVKLEGGAEQAEVIAALVSAGIPVMAHLGLLPQAVHRFGGYSVQRDRDRLLDDAKAVEAAGAFSILLECIPADVASEITAAVGIPTIGIGAGAGCDGQILVLHDLLGLTAGRLPRHAKAYADLRTLALDAVARYRDEVRSGAFPTAGQSFT
jgi:3-methyl-2-oxobutanoate hydroxymethyltransferase